MSDMFMIDIKKVYAENVHFTSKMVNRACLSVHTGTILEQTKHILRKFGRFITIALMQIFDMCLQSEYPNLPNMQI